MRRVKKRHPFIVFNWLEIAWKRTGGKLTRVRPTNGGSIK